MTKTTRIMLIEIEKKKRPEFWLEQRKWTKFLESVPFDGVGHPYCVKERSDLNIIRVRASQISTKSNSEKRYSVSINYDYSIVSVTVNSK